MSLPYSLYTCTFRNLYVAIVFSKCTQIEKFSIGWLLKNSEHFEICLDRPFYMTTWFVDGPLYDSEFWMSITFCLYDFWKIFFSFVIWIEKIVPLPYKRTQVLCFRTNGLQLAFRVSFLQGAIGHIGARLGMAEAQESAFLHVRNDWFVS